jgi:hypothetical protein
LTADASLSAEEMRGLKVLQDFVAGFLPAKLVTKAGEPVLDDGETNSLSPVLFIQKDCSSVELELKCMKFWVDNLSLYPFMCLQKFLLLIL